MANVQTILLGAVEEDDCLITHAQRCMFYGVTDSVQRQVWRYYYKTIPQGNVILASCGKDNCIDKNHLACMTRAEMMSLTQARINRRSGIVKGEETTPELLQTRLDALRSLHQKRIQLRADLNIVYDRLSKKSPLHMRKIIIKRLNEIDTDMNRLFELRSINDGN